LPAFSPNQIAICVTCILLATNAYGQSGHSSIPVLQQAEQLPADFAVHLFNVPLVVRVELNSKYLGDALLVLTQDDQVQLLSFTDAYNSPYDDTERNFWLNQLSDKASLGPCSQCKKEWLALEYSLSDSRLSILTADVEQQNTEQKYQPLPEEGSSGIIIQNQLNLINAESSAASSYYNLEAVASTGNWTHHTGAQVSKSGVAGNNTYYGLSQLYSQRELQGRALRAGYFANDPQGLSLRPGRGSGGENMLGLMLSSSDTLVIEQQYPSTTPVYVTAERPAVVEIYRNGFLINSQQVQAGLQAIDTKVLPSGIYQVQLRVVQDGQLLSESQAMIYKPSSWRDSSEPLRYSIFAGRQTQLFSSTESEYEGDLTTGATLNYLLNPSTIVGFGAQYIDQHLQLGTSVDYSLSDRSKLLANYYHSEGSAYGLDTQFIYGFDSGNLVLSQQYNKNSQSVTAVSQQTTALSWQQRINATQSTSLRLSHQAHRGTGADFSWQYRQKIMDTDSTWRLSAFNRPAVSDQTQRRNTGIELSLNINFGQQSSQYSSQYYGAIGNRTSRDGSKENTAELGWRKQIENSDIKNIGLSSNFDSYGVGINSYATVQNQYLTSDLYMSRSSFDGKFSSGLNLNSTVVANAQGVAASSANAYEGASLIVDLDSDQEDVELMAHDSAGQTVLLKPGRNVVPVGAYTPGTVSFDFANQHSAYVSLSQSVASYHLNKGGVDYLRLSAYKTLTVIGRLLDSEGKPLGGHHVQNHSSRTVTENSGFFTLAMRESAPTLDVLQQGEQLCHFDLASDTGQQRQDLWFVGDLSCQTNQSQLAEQPAPSSPQPEPLIASPE
jgi:outer membrane usher protein FimD/PapC